MVRSLFLLGLSLLLNVAAVAGDNTVRDKGVEIIYMPSTPISESHYPGLNPHSYILKKGTVHRKGGMPLGSDILVEQDVPIRLRDGVTIRADIYRPVDQDNVPAIMGWSSYGKRASWLTTDVFGHPTRMDVPVAWEDGLNKFEGPNPAYWVAHGYAIVAPDSRGVFMSEGDIPAWGPQDAADEYDVIEWIAEQSWSNGKVGLSGTSMLTMTQWFVGALRPPHLAAIAPCEGASDLYRDNLCRGGMPEIKFASKIFSNVYGNNRTEDLVAMITKIPLYNAYWKSKAADLEKIDVPAYITASWTNLVHTGGTFRAWESISSPDKWLRVHNTHEWNDYYNPDNVEELCRFFDHYLKGIDNGWEATPRVRLAVLDPGNRDTLNRAENEFPLARQKLVRYYLDNGAQFADALPQSESERSYDSGRKEDITFRMTFDRETEITGYIKLKLWVEARGNDDMDVFAFVRKLDRNGIVQESRVVTGATYVGPNGRLRVSRRAIDPERSTETRPYHTFDREEKLAAGDIVPVEIGFWPYSQRWQDGETLELVIGGQNLLVRPEFPQMPPEDTINKGEHVIHFGGKFDSHLLVPVI